jgi:hypothetical protein
MNTSNFESSFIFYSDNPHIFRPIDLKWINTEMSEELRAHNIYIITRANRAWFIPETVMIDRGAKQLNFAIAIQNGYKITHHRMCTAISDEVYTIKVSSFPNKEIIYFNDQGIPIYIKYLHRVLIDLPKEIRPDFEVLYIGKSFGRKNALNVSDRLYKQHHKKFKQILIDTQTDHPDKEIFVFSFNYAYSKNTVSMNSKGPAQLDDKEFERFEHLQKLSVSRKEKVDMIEEGLINYFIPVYNELCKESLTRLSTKAIHYFQKLDISGIVVELSLNETEIKLFSEKVIPKSVHLVPFATFQNKTRFNYASEESLEEARKAQTDYLLKFF